ncbi:hypothetical protein Dsin_021879 [Dipteronia sinensis]|uniref:Uncharacterized protein n=1 Tax=Dipteronia sinensis TaxID=43782 RepID=A0AAE0A104_9ROSI|nr:hypothetical protein Dsin_021879 [Dipteronia sinensis]
MANSRDDDGSDHVQNQNLPSKDVNSRGNQSTGIPGNKSQSVVVHNNQLAGLTPEALQHIQTVLRRVIEDMARQWITFSTTVEITSSYDLSTLIVPPAQRYPQSPARDHHPSAFLALKASQMLAEGTSRDDRSKRNQKRKESSSRSKGDKAINTIFRGPHTGRSNRERMTEIALYLDQQLTILLSISSRVHRYTFIYANTSAVVRRSLWQSLWVMVSLVSFPGFGALLLLVGLSRVLLEDRPTIMDHIISYYFDLFSSVFSRVSRGLSIIDDVLPSLVTAVENAFLTSVPSTDDIHDAVFAIYATSSPGLDGFSGRFYQRCWDVVGSDVDLAVQDFFITGVIFPSLNSSFIVLLPKLRDSILID